MTPRTRPTAAELAAHPLVAEVKARLEAAFGARLQRVILFGSRARGEAGPDSDWDFAVVVDGPPLVPEERVTLDDVAGRIALSFETLLALIPVGPDPAQWPVRIREGLVEDGMVL